MATAQTPASLLVGGLSVNNIQFNPLVVAPVTNIPIGGYQPLVAVSMTNEETFDDLDFLAYNTDTYLANGLGSKHALASNGSPYYRIALLDTGAQVHLFTAEAIAGFNFAGNNLLGSEEIPIGGAGGQEFVTIHDPVGIYATGFGNATGGASLSLNTSTLVGQYNVAIVGATDPSSILPDVVGLPLASQYSTVINTTQRKEIVVGGDVYESPDIKLLPFGDPNLPDYSIHAPLLLQPGTAFASPPLFFPNLDILSVDDFHDNPSIPSNIPGAFFLSGDISNDGTDLNNLEMFLDTGAQVTVVSELTATNLGFDVGVDTPEFFVEIQGAGGVVQNVPGFFVESFSLDTTGGDFTLHNVPVIVLNVPDPRDGINPVPAIVGTNLFGDRNIVINPEIGNAYLAISGIVTLTGDLNSDGFVGIEDLNIVLSHWNQEVTEGYLFSGDPTGDGFVGIADLNIVLSNWNAGTPPAGNLVPEPATLALFTVAGLVTLRRRAL
ncbi:MAG: aspartyl protease family protein [Phycisphaerales bacterium]